MKKTGVFGIVLFALISCPALADPFWVHNGKTDLATEGWTYAEYANPTPENMAGPVGPMETEVASEDAWKFVDHTTNYRPQYESPRMTAEQVEDFADGWEFKVRLSVPVPSVALHSAGFQFVEPGDNTSAKIYRINFTTNAELQQTVRSYNLSIPDQIVPDPLAPGFHTYRLVGGPSGTSLFIDDSSTAALTNIPGFVKSTLATALNLSAADSLVTIGSNNNGGTSTIYIAETSFTVGASGLAGDFNGNGTVDAADYVTWRKAFGTNDTLSGNGDENAGSAGTVDDADYLYWRANFGNPGPAASAGALAVPEPIVAPILVGMIALLTVRRRNGSR